MAKAAPGGGGVYKTVTDTGSFLKDIDHNAAGSDIANDVSNVLADGASVGGEVVTAASDPIGWLINKGVSFLIDLIAPLKKCLEMVTGDGAAVQSAAKNFGNVGRDIEHLVQEFTDAVNKGFAESKGPATDAARDRLSEFRDGIAGTAGRSGDIAQLLQFTSMIMQTAEDFIKGIISDVIEFILMSQAAGAVLSFFTFGATEVAATAADAAKVTEEAVKCEQEVTKVSRLLSETATVWEKIGAKFLDGKGGQALKKMVDIQPNVTKISVQHGMKNTVKDSLKEQGLKTVGYQTGGKPKDYIQSVGGISQKVTQGGQAIDYGTRGEGQSDQEIDRDFNT